MYLLLANRRDVHLHIKLVQQLLFHALFCCKDIQSVIGMKHGYSVVETHLFETSTTF